MSFASWLDDLVYCRNKFCMNFLDLSCTVGYEFCFGLAGYRFVYKINQDPLLKNEMVQSKTQPGEIASYNNKTTQMKIFIRKKFLYFAHRRFQS